MIAMVLYLGGPEQRECEFDNAWCRISLAISETCPDGWIGSIPGVHVAFYVPGTTTLHPKVPAGLKAYFRATHKLVFVNVRVPTDIIDKFDESFTFVIGALHNAVAVAADKLARNDVMAFDRIKMDEFIDHAKLYRTDEGFRARIEAKIRPVTRGQQLPLTGFSSDVGWSLAQTATGGRLRFIRINTAVKAIQGHPELPCLMTVSIPILRPNAHGLPTRDESNELETIEEELVKALELGAKGFMVGTTTGSGIRELLFYIRDGSRVAATLEAAAKYTQGHELRSVIVEDKEWSAYKQLFDDATKAGLISMPPPATN